MSVISTTCFECTLYTWHTSLPAGASLRRQPSLRTDRILGIIFKMLLDPAIQPEVYRTRDSTKHATTWGALHWIEDICGRRAYSCSPRHAAFCMHAANHRDIAQNAARGNSSILMARGSAN